MYQIDNSTAATTQPASTAAGTAGFFTDGNPATSTPATIVPAEWLNAVMMELANVVTGAGLTLSKPTYNQVLSAIKRLGQNTIILADTGAANAYTATNATPLVAGTWVDGVIQAVKIAHANTGASTYAPDGLPAIPIYGLGLQPLQGGEMALNGTAVLMRLTIPGVNSGNPICVLMECAGGAQQIPPATQSQHAAQFGQLPAVVGNLRSARMSITTASASATFAADEIVLESALGGLPYRLANFSKTINLATTGAGGMDTGPAPNNGYVALFAIYNPATGASALLGVNATSGSGVAQIYTGGNMPAGYTASALVSVWPTNGSGQFKVGVQRDRRIGFPTNQILNTSITQASPTSLNISNAVPPNAVTVSGELTVSNASTIQQTLNIGGDANMSDLNAVTGQANAGTSGIAANFNVAMAAAQTIYYSSASGGGTSSYIVYATGYTF